MKRAGEWLLFLQAISGIMDTFVGLSLYHKRGKPLNEDEEAQDAIEGRTRFIRPSVKRSKGE